MTKLRTLCHMATLGCMAISSTFVTPALARAQHARAEVTTVSGTCGSTIAKVKVSYDHADTSSTTFINVPGSRIDFTLGGTKPTCVVVAFSGQAGAAPDEEMRVQVALDSDGICAPNGSVLVPGDSSGSSSGDRAMNFVCLGVAPGITPSECNTRARMAVCEPRTQDANSLVFEVNHPFLD